MPDLNIEECPFFFSQFIIELLFALIQLKYRGIPVTGHPSLGSSGATFHPQSNLVRNTVPDGFLLRASILGFMELRRWQISFGGR